MTMGFSKILWFREASSYGNAEDMATGGSFYVLPIRAASSLAKEFDYIETEHIRSVASIQAEESQQGLYRTGGQFSGIVPWMAVVGTGFHSFAVLLKHALGKVTLTTKQKLYHWNDLLFPGLSIAENKAGGTYVYDGCQIRSLNLSGNVGGGLEATYDVAGNEERQLATVTPPALTVLAAGAHPYVLVHQITFELDDVVEAMTGFDCNIQNILEDADDRSYAIGSQKRACLVKSGHTVTGTLRRRHDADGTNISKFYTKFLSGATAKLEIICTHPTQPSVYNMKIQLGAVKFRGKTPNAADAGFIPEEIPFVAYDLDDTANSFIELNDDETGPATATGAYTGAGA